jgi:hypothetical protein
LSLVHLGLSGVVKSIVIESFVLAGEVGVPVVVAVGGVVVVVVVAACFFVFVIVGSEAAGRWRRSIRRRFDPTEARISRTRNQYYHTYRKR